MFEVSILRTKNSAWLFQPISVSLLPLILIYIFYDCYWKRRNLPPGPMPWLILGNIFYFLFYKSVDDMFLAWKQKYGSLITFWVGPIPMIIVSDVETMREYFVRNAEHFSNRWPNYASHFFLGGENGVIHIDGEKWKQQRRFALRVFRDFGVGRTIIEERIMKEVDFLINYLEEKCTEQEIDLNSMHAICVGNIITSILFGYRFPQDWNLNFLFKGSAEFKLINSIISSQSQMVMHPLMALYIILPSTTHIPVINYVWKNFENFRNRLWKFVFEEVQVQQKHKEIHSSEEQLPEVMDFTHSYLSEIERRKAVGEGIQYFDEWQLSMLLLDLFFAGMETTTTTLKWGFLLTMIHPDVQTKVQNELDQIGERITLADKSNCPYTVATLHEIQRVANILTFNLLHTTADNVVVGKYFYPAGTICIPQISIALNDPVNFPKPHEFCPERFLESDGITLKKYDAFIPFSIGKRQCLGESLAKAELFLIYANLMRHFQLHTTLNNPNPSTKRIFGLTVSPPPFKCHVKKRTSDFMK
ncbi:unnamed protein product [Thelazia callipaeda]|uniref:Unspecific monooxygenase n=1 Tax=Thelazia callipaeda TaxID=103827 RepID=A0A0N5CJI6_THECL|nr:unnamed protein product [Thelazia callipaeda]